MPKNSGDFQPGNRKAVSHGIHAFQDNGPNRLQPAQINRLAELRELVKEEPGRQELRQELTARMALICELGFAHLRERTEAGDDIWSSGIIRRLATYVAETRRLLDSFQPEQPGFFAEEQFISQIVDHDNFESD